MERKKRERGREERKENKTKKIKKKEHNITHMHSLPLGLIWQSERKEGRSDRRRKESRGRRKKSPSTIFQPRRILLPCNSVIKKECYIKKEKGETLRKWRKEKI